MDFKSKELTDVFECSESMLSEAKLSNWENVIAIEKQRSDMLKKIFSLPFTKIEKEQNNEIILQILTINKELEAITAKVRDKIRDQAGSINKGRHAVGVYAQNVG